jgi:hypothetical protein
MSYKINAQKNGTLNESDRLAISNLLVKAGYMVRIGKEKPEGKQNSQYVHYVELFADGEYPTK